MGILDFVFIILGLLFAILIAGLVLLGLNGKLSITVENTVTKKTKRWGEIKE